MKNTGIPFEKTVARIQQMMDPNSTVTHNEMIEDRIGNVRQCDVVIRGIFAGRKALGVIECKDHKRKQGPSTVEAFAKKTEYLNVNFRLIVAKQGFTDQALKLAKHEGIGCLSLLPGDSKQVGFSVGDTWFGRKYKWETGYLSVFPTNKANTLPEEIDAHSVTWNGKPVHEWFAREFFTTYRTVNQPGEWTLTIVFHRAYDIEFAGVEHKINGLAFTATRVCDLKKQWVTWSGDAFYDWEFGRFTVPPDGRIYGSPIDTTVEDWDAHDGVIPTPGKNDPPRLLRATLDCFEFREIPDDIVDLKPLIADRSFNSSV